MTFEELLIAVVDGQGGGMGRALVQQIKQAYPSLHVRALGTNAAATAAMLRAGADDGATGENAIVVSAGAAQIILGPVAAIAANGLLGEITPTAAAAIGASPAVKILLPSAASRQCSIRVAVGENSSLQTCMKGAMALLDEELYALVNP